MADKLKNRPESNLEAGVARGSLKWLNSVKNVKLDLSREKPSKNIEDIRGGDTLGRQVGLLGYAMKDGVESTYNDITGAFRKAEPMDVVMKSISDSLPKTPLKKK
jgi:hypothetical protein